MMTVLIVDDNAEMRRLLKSLVRPLAEAAYECGDGAEALAAYAAHRPDWVLMDIEMKVMDGVTATKEILAADPAAKVIVVTDYDHAEWRAAVRAAGACAFVPKDRLYEIITLLQPPTGA